MATPIATYSNFNGKRVVTLDGGRRLETDRNSAPAGVIDLKTNLGNAVVRVGNDLYEPLDVAVALGKL